MKVVGFRALTPEDVAAAERMAVEQEAWERKVKEEGIAPLTGKKWSDPGPFLLTPDDDSEDGDIQSHA